MITNHKKAHITQRVIWVLILVLILIRTSHANRNEVNEPIKCIKVHTVIQMATIQPIDIFELNSDILVYYSGKTIVNRYEVKNSKMIYSSFSDTIGRMEKQWLTYQYFIYNKNDKFGYWCKSLSDTIKMTKMAVDSAINQHLNFSDTIFNIRNEIMVEKKVSNQTVFEKYISSTLRDQTVPDTLNYYYSKKLNSIDFSWSRHMDSIKGMKLHKVVLVFNAQPYNYDFIIPRREFVLEFNKVRVEDKKEIKNLIRRFRELENKKTE